MRYMLVVAALLWGVAAAFADDPVGRYSVEGTNPGGGSDYRGTVSVEKTADTYRVIWIVGGKRYIGTGIGNKDFMTPGSRYMPRTAMTGAACGPIPAPAPWGRKSGSGNSGPERRRRRRYFALNGSSSPSSMSVSVLNSWSFSTTKNIPPRPFWLLSHFPFTGLMEPCWLRSPKIA